MAFFKSMTYVTKYPYVRQTFVSYLFINQF